FGINAVGLTGRKEEIDSVVRQYGARYEIEQSDSVLGYHIRHSTDLYLIGANGKLIRRFSYTDDPALILAGVEQAIQ
ncbi:MAG TPA: SCO family protein, partial [Blastocatellia bacterium]|nr:SCO family protein [Blastocatellia bacterium]